LTPIVDGVNDRPVQDLARLRRFNRLLTRRIGLLDERYLGSALPFTQARLLYEIALLAPLGTHHLRRLLAVDAGALSRGLAALEARGLARREPEAGDARQRRVRVTPRGRRLLATLDGRADARAASLAGLRGPERRRLVDAIDEARRLVLGAVVRIERRPTQDADLRAAQAAYLAELARRFAHPVNAWNQGALAAETSLLVVDGRRPVGCGVLREIEPRVGEIKRMWLHPDVRGLGLGARLLRELEAAARRAGDREIRLDTNEHLPEAIALSRRAGYHRVPRYNDNPDATHFFAKRFGGARRQGAS
jgi:DNA-binding MarR family transcriptional regulator/GNAT superfamily N-acetyltransferase